MCREPIGACEAIDWWACMQSGWQTDTCNVSIYLLAQNSEVGSFLQFLLCLRFNNQYCAAPLPAIFLQNGKKDVLYTNMQVSYQDYGSQS